MRSGRIAAARHQVQRRDAVRRRCRAMPLVLEQQSRAVRALRDRPRRPGSRRCGAPSSSRSSASVPWLGVLRRMPSCSAQHDLDGEDRALARMRADTDPMAQQISQALHDREAEAEAAASFARGIVELMVFLEDRLKFLVGDADCRCPRPRCSAFRRAGGSRAAPCRAWCISARSTAGCGSSARAGADRCGSTGRRGPRASPAPCACAW